MDPRVMPNAMTGAPPPTPTPPQGMVAPGTPRPGAMSEEELIRRQALRKRNNNGRRNNNANNSRYIWS